MNKKPILSIVTATRGTFSEYWLEQLLKIKGNIQFILVYPPDITVKTINEPRVRVLTSPYKGEVLQRFTGLLNAGGEYVLALDDDDFAHPDILECTTTYFKKFPNSWVLRLKIENIDFLNEKRIKQDWQEIPDLGLLYAKKQRKIPFHIKWETTKVCWKFPSLL